MSSSSLEVPRRQRPASRSKLWRVVVILAAVALVVGWAVWFVRTPDDLPTSTSIVDDAGVVGQEVYVGMFAVGDGFDRTLHISEVEVDVTSEGEVEVAPMLCRGGSLGVTTDAAPYCPELVDAEGAEFTSGDSIVLVTSASEPTEVEIGQLEISFREGIKWGTKPAGIDSATLAFAESEAQARPEDEPKPRDKGKKDDQKDGDRKDRRGNDQGDDQGDDGA